MRPGKKAKIDSTTTFRTPILQKRRPGRPKRAYKLPSPAVAPETNHETEEPVSSDEGEYPIPTIPEIAMSGESVSPETLARYELQQQGIIVPVPGSSPIAQHKFSMTGLRLRTIDREEPWDKLEEVNILELPIWFEKQNNDYNVKQYIPTTAVSFDWIDTPGDDSKDIRARRFAVKQNMHVPEKVWKQLVDSAAVVWRGYYDCSRACQRVVEDSVEPTLEFIDLDAEVSVAVSPKQLVGAKRKRSTKKDGGCPVELQVEINASDLSKATIWLKHKHKDADVDSLVWSRRLRMYAVTLSRREGATAGQVMKSLLPRLQLKEGQDVIPPHRKPTRSDIENIMPASRSRQTYARNAFASLGLFSEQNKDRVFLYQPHRGEGSPQGPSKLMCAITDEFCLGSALLYGAQNGAFLDATWRGMNQNFAPTSFWLGVDSKGHATPFAALLSQDVQAESLALFLREWMKKLKKYSQAVLSGTVPVDRTAAEVASIQIAAQAVIAGQWKLAFIMIDKDAAERNACKKAFPTVEVRVCQFHAMDAIQRWLNASHALERAKEKKSKSKATKKTFLVPKETHGDIQRAFRFTQRCRDPDDFPAALVGFEAALYDICAEHEVPEQYVHICNYFRENFWCPAWRDSITDIGLPPGNTRDKILNTNNFAESFIKAFKYTIIGMRRNKRVDTLVIIMADVMLPHYRIWRNDQITHAKDHIDTTQAGYDLWQSRSIEDSGNGKFQVNEISSNTGRRYQVTLGDKPSCTCTAFGQTGKMCRHMWAVKLYSLHGNFLVWADATNPRMAENSLIAKDLFTQRDDLDLQEPLIALDDDFHAAVLGWEQNGHNLATSQAASPLHSPPHPLSSSLSEASHHEDSDPLPHEDHNDPFTPAPKDPGGKLRKPSPIRAKPTHKAALAAPPVQALHTSITESTPRPLMFRHFRLKAGKTSTPKRTTGPKPQAIDTHRPIGAIRAASAPGIHNEAGQAEEDNLRRLFNFESWDDPWYQLRIEEADMLSDMLSELSRTLDLGSIVIADQGDNLKGVLSGIDTKQVKTLGQLTEASTFTDGLLNQIISSCPPASSLKHVLFLRLRHVHWTLVDFKVQEHTVSTIDSLPGSSARSTSLSQFQEYVTLVNFLRTPRLEVVDHSETWTIHRTCTGHQPISPLTQEITNLSCGFWTSLYAVLGIFDSPIKSHIDLENVVTALRNILLDYQTNSAGGLTRQEVLNNISQFIPNLQARLLKLESKAIWAPHRYGKAGEPGQVIHEDINMKVVSPLKRFKPKGMAHDEQLELERSRRLPDGTSQIYRIRGQSISSQHVTSLRPNLWVTSAILDFVSSLMTDESAQVWCLSTAFMPRLKDSYSQVSRLLPYQKRHKDPISILGDIQCIFIPFNEPIISASSMPSADSKADVGQSGSHWAALTVYPQRKQAIYKSSMMNRGNAEEALLLLKGYLKSLGDKRKADKGQYDESIWSFIVDENKPQQTSSTECGLFVVSYLLECRFGQEMNWTEEDILALRYRLAIQIIRQDLTPQTLVQETLESGSKPAPYYVAVTPKPNRKHAMSPTPTVSPEAYQALTQSSPIARKVLHRTKKTKLAPFPMKVSFASAAKGLVASLSMPSGSGIESRIAHQAIQYPGSMGENEMSGHDDIQDPDSLCPFCDIVIPDRHKAEFALELEKYLEDSQPEKRAENLKGRCARPGKLLDVHGLCVWHSDKLKEEEIESLGHQWPTYISQHGLAGRVEHLLPGLVLFARDPFNGVAFRAAREFWSTKGRQHCLSKQGMWESSKLWGLSYYGEPGSEVIFPIVMEALDNKTVCLTWRNWGGINDQAYAVQNVLIPEVILGLVMEDMGIGREEASMVMEESRGYVGLGKSRVRE